MEFRNDGGSGICFLGNESQSWLPARVSLMWVSSRDTEHFPANEDPGVQVLSIQQILIGCLQSDFGEDTRERTTAFDIWGVIPD